MSKISSLFAFEVSGKTFKIRGGAKFKVVSGRHYPENKIAKVCSEYLRGLREGLVVSVAFFGKPVSVITVNQGVMRLERVEIEGRTLEGSSAISKALGLSKTRHPLGLNLV